MPRGHERLGFVEYRVTVRYPDDHPKWVGPPEMTMFYDGGDETEVRYNTRWHRDNGADVQVARRDWVPMEWEAIEAE